MFEQENTLLKYKNSSLNLQIIMHTRIQMINYITEFNVRCVRICQKVAANFVIYLRRSSKDTSSCDTGKRKMSSSFEEFRILMVDLKKHN